MDRRPGSGAPPTPRPYPPATPPSTDLLDAETDELVAGRRPVEEAFVARREARRLLVVPQRRQALEKLVLHATSLRIPIVEVEGGTLTALSGFDGHQGIALVVAPRRYAQVDDILARAIEREEAPFVLVLDSLEDPQNVGTLLRSAEAAATHGVVFPTRHQAPMSPAAVKASAGAVEHLLLAPVDDLAGALADLHVRGLRIVGADADAALTVREADLRGPLALVVGSEGQGLGPAVRRRCDLFVRIPMRGAVGSLNASVAGSILLYEATTQRGGSTEGVAPERRGLSTLRPSVADAPSHGAETERAALGPDTSAEVEVAPATPEIADSTPARNRSRRRAVVAESPAEAPIQPATIDEPPRADAGPTPALADAIEPTEASSSAPAGRTAKTKKGSTRQRAAKKGGAGEVTTAAAATATRASDSAKTTPRTKKADSAKKTPSAKKADSAKKKSVVKKPAGTQKASKPKRSSSATDEPNALLPGGPEPDA